MLVDFEYLFFYKCFGLEFFARVIEIKIILWQKYHCKYQFLIFREAFKVGSTEISLTVNSKTTF